MAYNWSDTDLSSAKDFFTNITNPDEIYKTAQMRGLDTGQLSNLYARSMGADEAAATSGINEYLKSTSKSLSGGYTGNQPTASSVTATPGTVNYSAMGSTTTPVAPKVSDIQTPSWYNTYNPMYQSTFTNPQQYWDEYSQGQGAVATDAAARAMAKSGHTGMLPTLQTDAYKSYMSDYLPTVREGLAKGLTYDQGMNSNLEQMYGAQLGAQSSLYGSDVNKYGQQLGLEEAKLTAQTAAGNQKVQLEQAKQTALTAAGSQETQRQIAELEHLGNMYQVDSNLMSQVYATMANMFPHMSDADKTAMILQLKTAFGMSNQAATTTPTL